MKPDYGETITPNFTIEGYTCDLSIRKDINKLEYPTQLKVQKFYERSRNLNAEFAALLGYKISSTGIPEIKPRKPQIRYIDLSPGEGFYKIGLNFFEGNRCLPGFQAIEVAADLARVAKSDLVELYECDGCLFDNNIKRINLYKLIK